MSEQIGALLIGGPKDGEVHHFKGEAIIEFPVLEKVDSFELSKRKSAQPIEIKEVKYVADVLRTRNKEVWFYIYSGMSTEEALDKLFHNYRPRQ